MNADDILVSVAIGLMITAVSVIAHMWVAYTRAPILAIRGVKAWLESSDGLKSLQNWFSKALSLKDKATGLTVTQILARDAVGGLITFAGSADGKTLMEAAGKDLIKQARSYLESEEAVETMEAIGSRTVDAVVGYIETPEGQATLKKHVTPLLSAGAQGASEAVSRIIGSYLGNFTANLAGAAKEKIAETHPVLAMMMGSPGGAKIAKKWGPLIEMFTKTKAGGAPSGGNGGWG